ncbi:MAG: archaetidylserine decarboxylase [Spirochaetes bacterium]|nr:archaetidylserine decarboxylase [Spirochaetota bacterium]
MKAGRIVIFIFRFIPKGIISRLFGYLTRRRIPRFVLSSIINWYCKKFPVKKDEILYPAGGFKTLDEFFTRKLKEGVHKIDPSTGAVVSPVDAMISYYGRINKKSIIQAKGIEYSLSALVPSAMAEKFIDGDFITLYLSPADYHHIHSPVSGNIIGFFNIPGKLYSVQEFMVNGMKGLFSKNERVISYIRTDRGLAAVCKIGAMNVGRITLNYAGVVTNKTFRHRNEFFYPEKFCPHIKKGENLGTFHLGSTVILLFQKDMIKFDKLEIGRSVRIGHRIAVYK